VVPNNIVLDRGASLHGKARVGGQNPQSEFASKPLKIAEW